jgi:hypothetical protein
MIRIARRVILPVLRRFQTCGMIRVPHRLTGYRIDSAGVHALNNLAVVVSDRRSE